MNILMLYPKFPEHTFWNVDVAMKAVTGKAGTMPPLGLLTIASYLPEDFEILCEIDRRCFPPGIAYSPDDIEIALLEPGSFVVVGAEGDKIAGFILARRERGDRPSL